MQQEIKYYTCEYCFEVFKPTRGKVQKDCSNTCRNKSYHFRKNATTQKAPLPEASNTNSHLPTPIKETVNVTRITNAAIGTLTINALKAMLTKNENKASSKKNFIEILEAIKGRYHIIKNWIQPLMAEYPIMT